MKAQATSRIYPNVTLGENAELGDFVVLGVPPGGALPGEIPLVIGCNAIIRSHTVIYAGAVIGDDFATGHAAMIREFTRIGNRVSVGTHTVIEHHVAIEDDVRIHSQSFIPEHSTLEQGCRIGPQVVLANTLHPYCPKAKECARGPRVGRGAKIGANATLLPDIVIGENALVGAGAVVVGDVAPGAVVVGNPAQMVKHISELNCPYGLIEHPYGDQGG